MRDTTMTIRLRYPEIAPEGYAALTAFGHYINTATTLEPALLGLIYLRASQINQCEFCIAMHTAELHRHHEPDTRIDAVATWPTSDAFTPRERAALAWTELLTNLPTNPVTDEDYAAVNQFFHAKDLVDLTYAITVINAWNRLGKAFQPAWDPTKSHAPAHPSAIADDGGKVAED